MTAPKLDYVVLRAGTRYYTELRDGTLSGERTLVEDVEAYIITLGPVFNVYDVDDQVILVKKEDEKR